MIVVRKVEFQKGKSRVRKENICIKTSGSLPCCGQFFSNYTEYWAKPNEDVKEDIILKYARIMYEGTLKNKGCKNCGKKYSGDDLVYDQITRGEFT